MQQYFIDMDITVGNKIIMEDKDDCFHLKKVMRAKKGTQIEIVAKQSVYGCEVTQLEPHIELDVLMQIERKSELPIEVTIIQGLPKLDKMDLIIQKGTELGASAFIPWNAKRSVVKYDAKKEQQKQSRWQKIAKEAAEQAHRNQIPEIHSIVSTNQLQHIMETFDAIFIGSERLAKTIFEKQLLMKTLTGYTEGTKIACIIGPEGGIDEDEFQIFLNHQAIEIPFGNRILRTETAPLYFLSAVSFLYE